MTSHAPSGTRSNGIPAGTRTAADLDAAVRRFPLVAWGRPACPPLPERVADLADRAKTLQGAPAGPEAAEGAAALLNLAALIASDCRDAVLAEDLCHRHLDTYLKRQRPVAYSNAPLLLGPATNLARLRMRAADGDTALTILVNLLRAVRHSTDVTIDARTLPLSTLHGPDTEKQELTKSVWMQLLTDGTKALTLAGRWSDAAQLVEAYNGIGLHLFEGRQITIINHLLGGDHVNARAALAGANLTEAWEHEVAGCLALILAEPANATTSVKTLVALYDAAQGHPERPHYRARLGVTTAVLVAPHDQHLADDVLHRTALEAFDAHDGYAAREVLQHHDIGRVLDTGHAMALKQCVKACGLTGGELTGRALATLLDATASALRILDHAYRAPAQTP
ncbi:hypothetical protein C8K30_1011116 [Promicromonospora sp. AC04]|uniref:hypothetical protein n=1 Tax=Promicromonospora sp. AC04 TaxID=2135723 RepID=UPI000D35F7C4|nr:hypothetical protein [Promicromonospora sp. AC04]PUB32590.1 hypothetical protein C8K30_1011116 [Promicromonospora sp. AC04]